VSATRLAATRSAALWLALRIGRGVILLFVASIVAFGLLQLEPGNAADTAAGTAGATVAQIKALEHQLGLDRPAVVQYADWLGHAVRGNLGESLINQQPVASLIAARVPVTLSLTIFAALLTAVFAIIIGLVSAIYENRWPDRLLTLWTSSAIAAPSFFVGVVLVLVFALHTHSFPATGYVPLSSGVGPYLQHLFLPAVTLAIAYSASIGRQLRTSMIEVLDRDYMRNAEAKGLSWYSVVIKHGLRNASLPAVTLFGLEVIAMLGGVVLVEAVFNLPGLGSLAVQSVLGRDNPVILGILMVSCLAAIVVMTLVDASYRALNPRLRGD
jgi:peptide/nickel transport system permease protein